MKQIITPDRPGRPTITVKHKAGQASLASEDFYTILDDNNENYDIADEAIEAFHRFYFSIRDDVEKVGREVYALADENEELRAQIRELIADNQALEEQVDDLMTAELAGADVLTVIVKPRIVLDLEVVA